MARRASRGARLVRRHLPRALTLPLCTEPASAFAAAAAPAEHTPAESEEAPAAAAAAEEAPVAARTRNSPLRLAAVAHGQEGDAEEGELALVKAKAVKLLSPEELARKRSPDFRLPFGCPIETLAKTLD